MLFLNNWSGSGVWRSPGAPARTNFTLSHLGQFFQTVFEFSQSQRSNYPGCWKCIQALLHLRIYFIDLLCPALIVAAECQIMSFSSVIGGNVLFTQSQLSAIRVNKGGQGNKAEQKCETITKSRDNVSRVAEHSHWRICFNGFDENPDISKVSEFADTKPSSIGVFGEKIA